MQMQNLVPMNTIMRTRIVHVAFMLAAVIYGIVLWVIQRTQKTAPMHNDLLPMLQWIFGAVWLVEMLVLFAVIRPGQYRSKPSTEMSIAGRYQSLVILQDAFFISAPIYGLVLGFMGAPFQVFLIYAAAGLLMMLAHFPGEEKLQQFEDAVNQAG